MNTFLSVMEANVAVVKTTLFPAANPRPKHSQSYLYSHDCSPCWAVHRPQNMMLMQCLHKDKPHSFVSHLRVTNILENWIRV